jgi:hypothetical protein
MHLHLVRPGARPAPPRPAKVIQLETRRQAHSAPEHLKRVPLRPVI